MGTLLVSKFNFRYIVPIQMKGGCRIEEVSLVLKTSLPLGSALADYLIYMIYFNAI